MGIRLAQALSHGTDHRSQVCTTLTALGIEPPAIEPWDIARKDGRMFTRPKGRCPARTLLGGPDVDHDRVEVSVERNGGRLEHLEVAIVLRRRSPP